MRTLEAEFAISNAGQKITSGRLPRIHLWGDVNN